MAKYENRSLRFSDEFELECERNREYRTCNIVSGRIKLKSVAVKFASVTNSEPDTGTGHKAQLRVPHAHWNIELSLPRNVCRFARPRDRRGGGHFINFVLTVGLAEFYSKTETREAGQIGSMVCCWRPDVSTLSLHLCVGTIFFISSIENATWNCDSPPSTTWRTRTL